MMAPMSKPQKSAETPSPRLDFKQAAREILRDHPQAADRLLFIDPETQERHGTWRAKLRALTNGLFRQRLKEAFKAAHDKSEPIADIIRLGTVSAVLVTTGRETPAQALFDMNRQAGMLLVPRADAHIRYFQALFGTPYAATTAAADAYAAIRYLRQTEADPEFLRDLSLTRVKDFLVSGNPEHLSSFVLDKIAQDRDFSRMKIADLIDTVAIYVRGYTPSRAESDALVKEFAPLKGKPLDEAGLKKLAEITQATKLPLAAKLGKKILAASGIDLAKKPLPTPQPTP